MLPEALLEWYDKNARILPWRISPADRQRGIMPNPYHVWLSEIMLQQTTVATVKEYYRKFITVWHDVHHLANASQDDIMTAWAGLGYYSRARNLHKTAQIISQQYKGIFPSDEKELIKLAGIGRYSAASIAAIAFDKSAAVMDGNIERIISRLFCVKNPLPHSKNELYALVASLTPHKRAGDYAQAMMDLGATICTPKKPVCELCPIKKFCQAYKQDTPENYPVKVPKAPKPTHQGHIFLIIDTQNNILIEKRPNSGLFGGMDIFPYINPHEKQQVNHCNQLLTCLNKISETKIGFVKHIFTHFTLEAEVTLVITNPITITDDKMRFVSINTVSTLALPSLMQKALKFYNAKP